MSFKQIRSISNDHLFHLDNRSEIHRIEHVRLKSPISLLDVAGRFLYYTQPTGPLRAIACHAKEVLAKSWKPYRHRCSQQHVFSKYHGRQQRSDGYRLALCHLSSRVVQPILEGNYKYLPLPLGYVRIFCLNPGQGTETLTGTFEVCPIDSLGDFDSVSYRWEDPAVSELAICDNYTLGLSKAVAGMLRSLRSPTATRRLWVDASCINQASKNNTEKGEQIKIMYRIYEQARSVVVWLGEETTTTCSAFQMVSDLFLAIPQTDQAVNLSEIATYNIPQAGDPRWKSFADLVHNRYFNRTWPIPEVALAQHAVLRSGSCICDWQKLSRVLDFMTRTEWWSALDINIAWAARLAMIDRNSKQYELTLLEYLVLTVGTEVSLAEDKVFAMLSLASDREDFQDLINTGGPPERIYYEVAVRYLCKQRLQVLSFASDPAWRNIRRLPSWVPDWTCDSSAHFLHQFHQSRQSLNPIQDPSSPSSRIDRGIISVSAVIHERIVQTGLHINFTGRRYSILEVALILEQWRLLVPNKAYPSQDQKDSAFAQTLVAASNLTNIEDKTPLVQAYRAFRQQYRNMKKSSRCPFSDAATSDVHTFVQAVLQTCLQRSFFVTESGRIGIGPYFLRPGDVLCSIGNAVLPFVLRRKSKDEFGLVGEAYVHGGYEDVGRVGIVNIV